MTNKLFKHHKETWSGTHMGIHWSVVRNDWNSKDPSRRVGWCFYLHVGVNQIPEQLREKWVIKPTRGNLDAKSKWERQDSYKYYKSPFANLQWHCDMTFYQHNPPGIGEKEMIKAGCDYQHLYDEGRTYSHEEVILDARRCVNSLWEEIPELLVFSLWDGSLVKLEDIDKRPVKEGT